MTKEQLFLEIETIVSKFGGDIFNYCQNFIRTGISSNLPTKKKEEAVNKIIKLIKNYVKRKQTTN